MLGSYTTYLARQSMMDSPKKREARHPGGDLPRQDVEGELGPVRRYVYSGDEDGARLRPGWHVRVLEKGAALYRGQGIAVAHVVWGEACPDLETAMARFGAYIEGYTERTA